MNPSRGVGMDFPHKKLYSATVNPFFRSQAVRDRHPFTLDHFAAGPLVATPRGRTKGVAGSAFDKPAGREITLL